jgi:uncharacterized protein YbjT (DUF2867 family)
MKTLVIGGTGTVGSQVVQQLLARKQAVRVLTRDPAKAPTGVEAVAGDLIDPSTLPPAFDGVDSVFMVNALSPTEPHEAMMAVGAARDARVKRFVFMTVAHVDKHPLVPHFAAKMPVESALRASGIPFTILRPNSFMQNDLRYKDAMLGMGVYPQPLGDIGCSRVDARDIGELAAIALTDGSHEGRCYHVCGPRVESGEAVAALWTQALGKPVRYFGNDLDAWGGMMRQFLPAWLVYDLKLMYAAFMKDGLIATGEEVATMTQLLGRPPRDSQALAKETAAAWSTAAKTS